MTAERESSIPVEFLTVDAGNSRVKAIAWRPRLGEEPPRPAARLVLSYGEALAGFGWEQRFQALELGAPRAIGMCSVTNDLQTRALGAILETAFSVPVSAPPAHGLELQVRRPNTVGQDRLFAARGAAALGRSAIVLDAGTALTVDALEWLPGRPARFLGGAIAPGPDLLARALTDGGARLIEFEPRPGAHALGKETREALEAGVAVGFRGTALELARRVGLEAGLAGAVRLLCGGAARFLLEPEPFWPGELIERPDLVHEGLYWALVGP